MRIETGVPIPSPTLGQPRGPRPNVLDDLEVDQVLIYEGADIPENGISTIKHRVSGYQARHKNVKVFRVRKIDANQIGVWRIK